jgi:hypothetical protein
MMIRTDWELTYLPKEENKKKPKSITCNPHKIFTFQCIRKGGMGIGKKPKKHDSI